MYIANIPAGMQYWQKEIKNPCIQTSCFRSPAPRRLGSKTNSAEYVKVRQHQKHGYHPLQHEPAFPDDKFKVAAGLSCMLSVDAWFREARNTVWHGFVSVFLCCSVLSNQKSDEEIIHNSSPPFFTAKKPGAFPSPMPNEFGVCMVYGRCCTRCDGARQAWVSRHFCRDRR